MTESEAVGQGIERARRIVEVLGQAGLREPAEIQRALRSCLKTPSWLRAAAKAVDLRCAASTNPEDSPASRALPTTFSLALWPTERILRQLLSAIVGALLGTDPALPGAAPQKTHQ